MKTAPASIQMHSNRIFTPVSLHNFEAEGIARILEERQEQRLLRIGMRNDTGQILPCLNHHQA
eukprot:6766887-Pyramimonas_sp.AAC.1